MFTPMILVLIGTKAQLIKMAPVMLEMDKQSLPYKFVLTGQHKETIEDLIEDFGLRQPDHYLVDMREASTSTGLFKWLSEVIKKTMLELQKEPWIKRSAICLVHGDTLSTLAGAVIARKFRIPLAHVEAGLRSYHLLNPFPEELVRILVSRLSSFDYAPGTWAERNLIKTKRAKNGIINTIENTLLDSVRFAVNNQIEGHRTVKNGVVSIHRFENIYNRKRMEFILLQIEQISRFCKLYFVLHPATLKRLKFESWFSRLAANPNIILRNRMRFTQFIRLIHHSNFLITDGGSNQEEASYLGVPCLLMRKATERLEGLGQNVVLSKYNADTIQSFIRESLKGNNRKDRRIQSIISPSAIIVNDLKKRA